MLHHGASPLRSAATRRATPPRPRAMPASRRGARAWRSPRAKAATAPTIGHAGDEQPGEAGREVPLGVGQQHPRDRHLQHAERHDRSPVGERRAERSGARGDDEQRDDGHRRSPEHDDGWREVLDGDLDEQVRHAPDGAHRGEQDPLATGHRTQVGRSGRSVTSGNRPDRVGAPSQERIPPRVLGRISERPLRSSSGTGRCGPARTAVAAARTVGGRRGSPSPAGAARPPSPAGPASGRPPSAALPARAPAGTGGTARTAATSSPWAGARAWPRRRRRRTSGSTTPAAGAALGTGASPGSHRRARGERGTVVGRLLQPPEQPRRQLLGLVERERQQVLTQPEQRGDDAEQVEVGGGLVAPVADALAIEAAEHDRRERQEHAEHVFLVDRSRAAGCPSHARRRRTPDRARRGTAPRRA